MPGIIGWLIEDGEEGEGGEGSMRQHLLDMCQQPPHHVQIQALRLLQVRLMNLEHKNEGLGEKLLLKQFLS